METSATSATGRPQQEQEADPQHEGQDVRGGGGDGVEVVGGDRGLPADQDPGARTGQGGGNQPLRRSRTAVTSWAGDGVAADGHGQRLDAALGRGWIVPAPKRGSAASTVSSLDRSARVPGRPPSATISAGSGFCGREVAFHRQVALLGRHGAGQGRHPALTDVQAEDGDRQRAMAPAASVRLKTGRRRTRVDHGRPDPGPGAGVGTAEVAAENRQRAGGRRGRRAG